ncbi:hypothetical protein [Actinoplanes siamensis]|nr:hypothetical protein [Actinoplanes siamensis]
MPNHGTGEPAATATRTVATETTVRHTSAPVVRVVELPSRVLTG